jgi:predicted dehydrogenase
MIHPQKRRSDMHPKQRGFARPVGRGVQSRRAFLGQSAALAASPWIIPASALGANRPAPSNRINLGFIGVGMMGRGHLHRFLHAPDAQVLALADVDRWRRETNQKTVEAQYAQQRASGTYRGCDIYNDFRELLARSDIDAVVIATGERWHPVLTAMAARAGKDVYVEKPTALTIAEARAMVGVVRRYGRVCQVGLQQRSAREFRLACQLVRDGALGKIERVYTIHSHASGDPDLPAEPTPDGLDWDLWLGPSPWRPFNHRLHHLGPPRNVVPWDICRDFGGGSLTSGAVHAFDTVQWGLGTDATGPVEVVPPESGQATSLTFKYSNGVLLHVVDGRLDPKKHVIPKGWDCITSVQPFGAVFVGERGWIHVGRQGYLTSYPADIIRSHPGRYDHGIAVGDHHSNWLHAVRTRRRPACDVAIGSQSTIISLLGCIARWTGRPLKWDPVAEQFLGDDEANRMTRRAMREPWRI